MIKRISYIVATVAVMFFAACKQNIDVVAPEHSNTPEGWVEVEFSANAPIMTEVAVRAVDPDGVDVQNMILFCFNDFGLYITHVAATLNPVVETPSLSGTYKAVIPAETRIIHFVANQNPNLLDADMFLNRTEDEIQDDMVGASGMIIYWSRFVFDNSAGHQQQLAAANGGEGIRLIRNQAKISLENGTTNGFVDITGFVVCNTNAFGTTAPYHPDNRFPVVNNEQPEDFIWPGDDYVTLPSRLEKLTDVTDVYSRTEEYLFEHENSLHDPVSVILRGKPAGGSEELYYRVMIIDESGEQLMIRRNHHYKLSIIGELTYGSKSFEEALSSPATNNVWVAVADWVDEVSFGGITLSVDQTSVVLGEDRAGTALQLHYTITSSEGSLTQQDMAEVSWLDGNSVAAHTLNHTFVHSGNSGRGTITLQLLQMGDNPMLEGTVVVKKGRLHRNIKVTLIKTQKFTPVWAATQIYGGDVGELATLKFTVPDNFPFFPFNVYVSVNSLDARTETTGRVLPVVREGEEQWYGIDNGIGYKYIYTVTEPGTQRIYLHNVLVHEDGAKDTIMLEAEFFETVTKEFVYVSHHNSISVDGLSEQRVSGVTDEPIYYMLVPRKVNAPVRIDMLLSDTQGRINAGENDEFFIYNRTLDSLSSQSDRDMFGLSEGWEWDCRFYKIDDEYWKQSTNGRMLMFKPVNNDKEGEDKGKYSIYLKTNVAKSDDVIRIASNQPDSYSAIPGQSDVSYLGNTYRSFIFELATYRPFRFAAQVAIAGGTPVGTWNTTPETLTAPDPVDHLEWTYLPNQSVDINLEITSFEGSDGHSADPFGTEFDIYIDAPMLKIDHSRLTEEMAAKLKPHPTIAGRFVYTVDASRDKERMTGNGQSVMLVDGTAGVSQDGERKTLPFITNDITTAGEIAIYSDMAKVEFFEKRFKISNQLIEGDIQYNNGAEQLDISKGEFVSFAVKKSGVRIGSMNIVEDGRFTLNLRAEYDFSWTEDEVELSYIHGGKGYSLTISSLDALYNMVSRGETLVLQ
ncbi:MAG: hypothetical protein J6Q95_00520 [Alistipes sp.]|nr:hypothetical protein [Alistipes sp.]